MNSIVMTLTVLKNSSQPMKARDIGLTCGPIRSLNTIIKNIHFLRKGYGNSVILDDDGKRSRDSRENHYWFNPDWVFQPFQCNKISATTAHLLDDVMKSVSAPIQTPEIVMKHSFVPSALSFDESLIVADYFHSIDNEYESILNELIEYRVCTETFPGGEIGTIHYAPFSNVPSALMKKIDKIAINQLCAISI